MVGLRHLLLDWHLLHLSLCKDGVLVLNKLITVDYLNLLLLHWSQCLGVWLQFILHLKILYMQWSILSAFVALILVHEVHCARNLGLRHDTLFLMDALVVNKLLVDVQLKLHHEVVLFFIMGF